jgi:hypothetical protein
MSDNYTPDDPSDDFLTSFSSAGPTVEGFVKPEVVAPGGHMLGLVGNSRVPVWSMRMRLPTGLRSDVRTPV